MTTFRRRLLDWYDRSRRDLPWRQCPTGSPRPDPYHVLVSEAMLQQTQVATVIPYFNRFIARFGTMAQLAGASEQDVLRLWQGLGYYSRARNLLAAARRVSSEFGGQLPQDVQQLLKLPGIGRYTAGAVGSIAFGLRCPILDGNVERVLCRLDRVESDPREKGTRAGLWLRAEELLPAARPGDFNSALMELGATVCTPRSPACISCPVRRHCSAREAGVAGQIPPPRKAKPTPLLHRHVFCIGRDDRWLIEQRPTPGRWAGLWQFVTHEAEDASSPPSVAALPVRVSKPVSLGEVTHALTHRRYHFAVFRCQARSVDLGGENARDGSARTREWVTLEGLSEFPVSRPHLKVVELLRRRSTSTGRARKYGRWHHSPGRGDRR